jgi:hypothetical protein
MHKLLLLLASVLANAADPLDYDVLQYINPLIGSANGGTSMHKSI